MAVSGRSSSRDLLHPGPYFLGKRTFLAIVLVVSLSGMATSQSDSAFVGTPTVVPTDLPILTAASQLPLGPTESSGSRSYVIYPKDRTDSTQTNETDKYIQNIIGNSPSNIYISPYTGVENWAPNLTDHQLAQVVGYKGVNFVIENVKIAQKRAPKTRSPRKRSKHGSPTTSTSLTTPPPDQTLKKRDGTITSQLDAVTELSVIAQPSGSALADVRNYVFDNVAGEGAYIYLIEYGINPGHPEFVNMVHPPQQTDWLFVPRAPRTYVDSDTDLGHGSCMASKAAGAKFGVAKSARLVIVKSDDEASEVNDAFRMALDHIKSNGREGKAVVVYAGGEPDPSDTSEPDPQPWPRIKEIMQEMFAADVVIINASGNMGYLPSRQDTDTIPTIWEGPDFPLIVVSAVNMQGDLPVSRDFPNQAPWAQGPSHVTLWAPGDLVKCAEGNNNNDREEDGTSLASAMVAGAVAYFLSFESPPFTVGGGNTAQKAKDFLRDTASWRRHDDSPQRQNVLWNLLDGTKDAFYAGDDEWTHALSCMAVQNTRYHLEEMVCSCNNGQSFTTMATDNGLGVCDYKTPPGAPLSTMPIVSPSPTPYNPAISSDPVTTIPTATSSFLPPCEYDAIVVDPHDCTL